jgi:hypothetical protein
VKIGNIKTMPSPKSIPIFQDLSINSNETINDSNITQLKTAPSSNNSVKIVNHFLKTKYSRLFYILLFFLLVRNS